MGKFEISVTKNRVPALVAAIRAGSARAVTETAIAIGVEAQRRIEEGPKTGRIYGAHQASAPGEAPANKSGALAESVRVEPVSDLEADVLAAAPGAPYGGLYLEFGSPDGKIAPRPFMTPAAELGKPLFIAAMKTEITEALR